jgi:RNA polymerase sigma-70 factor (ECF subfamily)
MKKEQVQALSDDELLLAARTGDEKAFTELVNRYGSMVHGFAFKLCRDRRKADESFQDTFINVYRKLDQFDGKSKFTTWLYAIVANNCLMAHRKRKIDAETESLDAPHMDTDESGARHVQSWDDSPIDTLMNKELRKHLDTAIQRLPADYRVVFVLRDVEQQSAEETAKILHLTVPAVKSRLRRARVFLREQLHQYMIQ